MPAPRRLYLDNAATSHPKPPEVLEAMVAFARAPGASPGRGAYAESIEARRLVDDCRELLRLLVHGVSARHVVFTANATDALNLAIGGIARHWRLRGKPVHVVTTAMDHNSVLRPLESLAEEGLARTRVPVDPATGVVDPDDLMSAIRPETRLMAVIHGSNVTGTLQPLAAIGARCRAAGVPLLVDAAQTMGHVPIDVEAMAIDLLAFPGHKGLLGPSGTGGLLLRPGLESVVDPVRTGGTGSRSESDVHPTFLPDRYEAGSLNTMGIVGLAAGVRWILAQGVEVLWARERALTSRLLAGVAAIEGLQVPGPTEPGTRCGVVSIVHEHLRPEILAQRLEAEHGILARAGLHCAPLAHRALGTDAGGGAVRLSLGPFLTAWDMDDTIEALAAICVADTAPVATVP